jgi:hypothetical protein
MKVFAVLFLVLVAFSCVCAMDIFDFFRGAQGGGRREGN